MWKISCFVLFVTVFTLSHCDNPGLKLRIFQKGLDNANGAVNEFLQNKIRDLRVGKLFGGNESLKFNISYTKLLNYTIINSSMTILPDTGIQITISNSNATINSLWIARNETSEVKSITVMEVPEASITVVIGISKNKVKFSLFSMVNCTTDIKKLEYTLSPELKAMFENYYSEDELKKYVLGLLNLQVCKAMTANFTLWTTNISSFSGQYNVDAYVGINYQLVNSPVFTKNYFDIDINGSFYAINNGTDHPFAPANFSFVDSNDSAMCIGISEDALNSVSQAYHDARVFRIAFTHPMINETLKKWLEGSGKNISEPRGRFKAIEAPVFTLKGQNMTINFVAQFDLVNKESNPTVKKLADPEVTLNVTGSISADVSVSEANSTLNVTGLNVTGSLTLNSTDLNVTSNNWTNETKAIELQNSVQDFLKNPLLAYFKRRMKTGFTFPNFPFLILASPALLIEEKFIQMNTGAEYNTSTW